jgi:hypothetical protein
VKVNAASGVVAFSGLPIVVAPGTGKQVVIRGMTIKAATPGTGDGITVASGRLSLEGSVIDGWNRGIVVNSFAEQLHVGDCVMRNMSLHAIVAFGAGHTSVANTRFVNASGSGYAAYEGNDSSTASISGCEISGGGGGIFNFFSSSVLVDDCRVTNVASGLYTEATMRVSRTIVTKSSIAGVKNLGGTLESFGNNVFRGNALDTDGPITNVPLQ